jgi:hypothetical protein
LRSGTIARKSIQTFTNKSTKGQNYDEQSNKLSVVCTGNINKVKPKKNGFFDESDTLNSQRANAINSDKMIEDFNMLEQCINSNANTDRGHYHNLLIHQD